MSPVVPIWVPYEMAAFNAHSKFVQLRAWQGGGGGGEARLWVWQSRARTQQQNVALLDAMSSLEIRHTANVWHHHKLVGRGVQAYAPK